MINIRRNPWFKFVLIVTLLAFIFSITACGATKNSNGVLNSEGAFDYAGMPESPASGVPSNSKDSDLGFINDGRESGEYQYDYKSEQKIIYNGRMNIEVDDIEKAVTAVESAVKNAGGYLLNSTKTENDRRYYVSYDFKVPVDGLHSLVEQIEALELGIVTTRDINGRDVTEEYLDLSSRLKAKRVYEERLLELFVQADKTEDLLRISNDLSRVQEEIESLEGRRNYLAYHAENSSLTIELYQYKNKVSPTASTWAKSLEGLKITMKNIGDFLVNLTIWFVSYLPIIIIFVALIVGAWFLFRRRKHRKEKLFRELESEILENNK